MDLPELLSNDMLLSAKLRSVFRDEGWCQTLYDRFSMRMSKNEFAESIKTTASCIDARAKQKSTEIVFTLFRSQSHHKTQSQVIPT